MLCLVCQNIEFRLLPTWKGRDADICNPENTAFPHHLPTFPSDDDLEYLATIKARVDLFYFHHDNCDDLYESARTGCYFCTLLLFALDEAVQKDVALPRVDLKGSVVLRTSHTLDRSKWKTLPPDEFIYVFCGSTQCSLHLMEPPTGEPRVLIDELIQACSDGQHGQYSSTGSDLSLRLARSWHQRCVDLHKVCDVKVKKLPNRVIDLGENDSFQPQMVENVEEKQGDYVTLSHCWGDGKPLACDEDPENPGCWKLPLLQDWPKTFQDAVQVTRFFGIRYLWIDSPCILQGVENVADWEIESAKMAAYFQNSAFTIFSSAATSGADGLFQDRNLFVDFAFPMPNKANTSGEIESYISLDPIVRFGKHRGADFIPNLHSRGWILQEELLSAHSLSFSLAGLEWKCQSARWTPNRPSTKESQPRLRKTLNIYVAPKDPAHCGWRNRWYDAWYDVMNNLNCRNMTHQNDMLPAISGIVESIQPHLDKDDEYLAGIWKTDMIVGLLWCVGSRHEGRLTLPSSTRNFDQQGLYAPSWSWVSQCHRRILQGLHPYIVTTNVCLNNNPCSTELIRADITLRNPRAPYGVLDSGVLHFSAQLFQVQIIGPPFVAEENESDTLETRRGPRLCQLVKRKLVSIDKPFGNLNDAVQWSEGDCLLDDEEDFDRGVADGNEEKDKTIETIDAFFLPLLTHSHDGRMKKRTMGLILVPAFVCDLPMETEQDESDLIGEKTHTYYQRIGRGSINSRLVIWERCELLFQVASTLATRSEIA